MRRLGLILSSVALATFYVVLGLGLLTSLGAWAILVGGAAGGPFGVFVGQAIFHKEKNNGSNRRTTADNPDPGAGEGAGSSGGGSEAPARPSLPVVEQAEPVKAWKVVSLWADRQTVHLQSCHSGEHVNDPCRARCTAMYDYRYYTNMLLGGSKMELPAPHKAPDLDCTCGFYALKQKPSGNVVAEVDLYGTVIEAEQGYRAEYQRVLAVEISRDHCSGFLCDEQPQLLDFVKDPGNKAHRNPAPVCVTHATPESVELSKVAARLGVEVRWAE